MFPGPAAARVSRDEKVPDLSRFGWRQAVMARCCSPIQGGATRYTFSGVAGPVSARERARRAFSFVTKTPPAAVLLLKAAGIAKGSGTPNKEKVGKVTEKQVREIATQKMPDLNAASVETAIKSIKGTARSMGIEVVA